MAEDDLEFANGGFSVKGSPDQAMTIKEAAFAAHAAHNLPDGMEPGLEATAVYDPPNFSWPSGAHAAVVEVDIDTGDARLVRYVAVDDVGAPVNPMVVDGQVHGGVAQAVAAALYEEGVYDEEGNLVTQNLTTYLMPSAAELPSFEVARTETPSPTNPLGVKGVGETGAIAAAPVINAVVDALSHLGVTDIQLRPRRSVSGARSRRRSSDPGTVRLRRGGERRARPRAARPGRGGEAARRRALADPRDADPAGTPSRLVDIGRLSELAYVRDGGATLAIG